MHTRLFAFSMVKYNEPLGMQQRAVHWVVWNQRNMPSESHPELPSLSSLQVSCLIYILLAMTPEQPWNAHDLDKCSCLTNCHILRAGITKEDYGIIIQTHTLRFGYYGLNEKKKKKMRERPMKHDNKDLWSTLFSTTHLNENHKQDYLWTLQVSSRKETAAELCLP